ncbi:MAG: lactate racemase domain-containing protein [Planctomycetota bacterium]|jgi:nickel-dependent lactate racemase
MDTHIEVLRPSHPKPRPEDLPPAVDDALSTLDVTAPLTVVVNDPYRHTNTPAVLAVLAQRVDPADVRLLVATGAHRISDSRRAEHEGRLRRAADVAQIEWHDCHSDALISVGTRGSWLAHPWLMDTAGGLLAIGSVEPHYFAGLTGAHKTLTVGCAGFEDISANHAEAVLPDCRPCRLRGNPVFTGIDCMLEVLQCVRPVAAVNLVQAGDAIVSAHGGGAMTTLHEAGLSALRVYARRIHEPADAIIADVHGAVAGNLYQAEKGIKNSEDAVRDGGVIILTASCPEGLGCESSSGAQRFVDMLSEARTYADTVQLVKERGYQLGDHKAVRLRRLTDPAERNVRVIVVSDGLPADVLAPLGIGHADSVRQAMAAAGVDPTRQKVYRLENAGNLALLIDAHWPAEWQI